MRYHVFSSFFMLSSVLSQSSNADLSSLLAQWSQYAPKVTQTFDMPTQVPTRLGNVDPPPTSLMLAIFTGVPQDVLVDLMNSDGRKSIKAEFDAGATPSWYIALPFPVKSYIESINKALATGGNDYTGTEKAPEIPNCKSSPEFVSCRDSVSSWLRTLTASTDTASPGADPTSDGAPDEGNEGDVQATSSSKALAAPRQTWGAMEMFGLSGAVGILGLAAGL